MFRWAGIQENTWVISDESIADALTKICEAHFGDLTEYPITPNSEPIRVVSAQYFRCMITVLFFVRSSVVQASKSARILTRVPAMQPVGLP
jgi:hypothetical protein